ncbi:MAG TPA: DegT/DnrJ/EryC1/StrS family aminotransferase [Candidatus Brocadiia bacterium]|nr:DegT/DnrJ/EryC1/StrS family aminotransferase [Candidatus Brocadiia bacterium]
MKVPLLDLTRQYRTIKDEIDSAIAKVVESQLFILGRTVADFEETVKQYTAASHAVSCASGTDALLLSLMALGIGPGDEVITTPFTFFATAGAIHRAGAKPVFVDILPDSFNIDPELAAVAVTPATKAIMPVHLYGQCADMEAIMNTAEDNGLSVIEDAAQALGAKYLGRMAGTIGTTGCYSFFPSKNLGGFGDGGMIVTNDDAIAGRLRSLRVHGQVAGQYVHAAVGLNSRLDAIQAAALTVKLAHLDEWCAARAVKAAYYDQALDHQRITVPARSDFSTHIYHQYVIRIEGAREAVKAKLKEADIGHSVYYPVPLHLQECFKGLGYMPGDLPVAEKAAEEVLALPVFPELTEQEQEFVCKTILSALA